MARVTHVAAPLISSMLLAWGSVLIAARGAPVRAQDVRASPPLPAATPTEPKLDPDQPTPAAAAAESLDLLREAVRRQRHIEASGVVRSPATPGSMPPSDGERAPVSTGTLKLLPGEAAPASKPVK